jgi:hypothetical protein
VSEEDTGNNLFSQVIGIKIFISDICEIKIHRNHGKE